MSAWKAADVDGRADPSSEEIATVIASHQGFFDDHGSVLVARAPGRLDVMGGIADYSGSRVLELSLSVATWAAVQRAAEPTIHLCSTAAADLGADPVVTIPANALAPGGVPLEPSAARAILTADPKRAWTAYVAGVILMLGRAYGAFRGEGLRVLVHSNVPLGKGLSSSAAVEVATMKALADLAGLKLEGRELALLAQQVENLVVGAPCGVMDQMTSACGRRDHLLALLCQPAEPEGHVRLPPGLEVWGVDSGIRHAVTGADYGSVRVGAFMGYRIVADLAGLRCRPAGPGRVVVDDPELHGYLANIAPSTWVERFRAHVPERLEGRSFLAQYGGLTDTVTEVDPSRTYAVRACTEHPILEHHRVQVFRALLEGGAEGEGARALLGELMAQSHASYGACGLGSDGTDRLAALVRAAGPREGLYGAKITGGGSGGTVAVLARAGSRRALERVAAEYVRETGRTAAIFGGSSDGALEYGTRVFHRR
ncbi:MAG TPA: galactokinase family protein [Polyangiaceae bacterium]|jgi:L-arabinokinase